MNLNCNSINDKDLLTIIDAQINKTGLREQNINSFNNFVSQGVKQIVTQIFQVDKTIKNERNKTPEDNQIGIINFNIKFIDCKVGSPVIKNTKDPLLPNMARKRDLTYSAPLNVTAVITAKAFNKSGGEPKVVTEQIKDFHIANIPVMVGSTCCYLEKMSAYSRQIAEEDPNDVGGYFIIKGVEWVISIVESRLFNQPHIFNNRGHQNEITRLEFISKPGDAYENSSEIIIRYVTNDNIYITFTSNAHLKYVNLPFYIIFKLFGNFIDQDIIENIIYGYDSSDIVSNYMLEVIKKAMKADDPDFKVQNINDYATLLDNVVTKTAQIFKTKSGTTDVDEKTTQIYLKNSLLKNLDKQLFPHIGLSSETRYIKLRYLGHLIHKMLLVEMDIVSSSDRDSLKGKRLVSAGRNYAKTLKTEFNLTIVQTLKHKLTTNFRNMPFSNVNLADSFKSSIRPMDLEKALVQSIGTGNSEIKINNKIVSNRLTSEMLHRKNELNVSNAMRIIRTPNTSSSKQDQRSDEMRRAHPSYNGYICPVQSADTGEQVGMVKQMAIGAEILESGNSEILKELLLSDKDLIPLNRCFPKMIYSLKLTKILVNGDWIACCKDSHKILQRYKELRRGIDIDKINKKMDSFTTIHWSPEENEIKFWVDPGRIVKPLLIVRNNGELDPVGRNYFKSNYDPIKNTGFLQDILLTNEHIHKLNRKEITILDLMNLGIIEYISPEELENCYVCMDINTLKSEYNNPLKQFTHCEIPQSMLGITALTCPFANHNQNPRITFQTNQVKQTCGWYSLSYPYRFDTHAILQLYCESPLVKTLANNYIYSNGLNVPVAIACYGGNNQEDSLILNKSSSNRGVYEVINYHVIKTKLEKEELFGNPNESDTIINKKDVNFGKVVAGFPKPGTKVEYGDIVIAKNIQIPKTESGMTKKDTSIVYDVIEPGVVEQVINDTDQEGERFAKVKISNPRPLENGGDKFSSRAGQKGVTSMAFLQTDMPFTESGIIPTLIMNPHAIPSRMTIGQLVEGISSKLAAVKGYIDDGTIFTNVDVEAIGDELEKLGYDRYGTEYCYDGKTGEPIDYIFLTPTFYQRLQKFVLDEVYSISTGPTCIITRQPLEGRSKKGGLRIGEMEKDCILSHGSSHFIMEKFRDDSDGFDIYICRTCNKFPIVNEEQEIYKCNTCRHRKLTPDIVKVKTTWTSKLFIQELQSAYIGVSFEVSPFIQD